MDDKRKQEHLRDVDRVLDDVREHLKYEDEEGEVFELRALQLLLEVTKAFHSQRNIHTLITLVLDSVLSFTEAERAFLMLLDEHNTPRFKMGRSQAGAYLTQDDFMISQSVVKETVAALKPVILIDAPTDDRFKGSESIINLKLRTVMAAPLRCGNDCVLGLLYVDSRRPMNRYSKHHLNVLTSLADQAAIALNNVQKFETHTG